VSSWGCRRGRSFDLALVLELLAFVTLPASGIDGAGECSAGECSACECSAFECPTFEC
jgi:hypothetical protein